MLMGLPLSIHRKSYWPVTLAAVAGTAADFMDGNTNCRQQREALLACIARNEAAEAAKGQGVRGPQQPLPEPQQEEWPEQQGGWPDKGWEEEASSGGGDGDGGIGRGGQGEGKGKWGGRWTEGKEETVVTPVVDPLYGGGGGEGERGGDGRGERTRKW
eukprot:jgi/Undpi1/8569/HiC_scaffold_25.g11034.m1